MLPTPVWSTHDRGNWKCVLAAFWAAVGGSAAVLIGLGDTAQTNLMSSCCLGHELLANPENCDACLMSLTKTHLAFGMLAMCSAEMLSLLIAAIGWMRQKTDMLPTVDKDPPPTPWSEFVLHVAAPILTAGGSLLWFTTVRLGVPEVASKVFMFDILVVALLNALTNRWSNVLTVLMGLVQVAQILCPGSGLLYSRRLRFTPPEWTVARTVCISFLTLILSTLGVGVTSRILSNRKLVAGAFWQGSIGLVAVIFFLLFAFDYSRIKFPPWFSLATIFLGSFWRCLAENYLYRHTTGGVLMSARGVALILSPLWEVSWAGGMGTTMYESGSLVAALCLLFVVSILSCLFPLEA